MKRILAILLMGILAISLVACGSTQDAASEEVTTAVEEEPVTVTEEDINDTTDTTKEEEADTTSFRPGQALTSDDLDILTANKGTLLSRTLTQSEFHQIINKFMDSSYVKDTAYKLAADGLVWHGGSRWDCSAAVLYLWGVPVYTYQTVNQISENDPGDLQYGDLLFYGTTDGSDFKISHVAVYLGQYYLDSGDTGYYQLENDRDAHENTKEGRDDGVKISPFRAGDSLLHVARIM